MFMAQIHFVACLIILALSAGAGDADTKSSQIGADSGNFLASTHESKKSVAALFLKALLLLLKYTSAAANGAKYNHAAGECRGLWFARRFGDKQSA